MLKIVRSNRFERDVKRAVKRNLDISKLAHKIHNKKADNFLEWFEYSDKTIDGQSQKKAYLLFDSPIYYEQPE